MKAALLFLFNTLIVQLVYSQTLHLETIAAGGDYFEQPNGSVSFTMGEGSAETYTAGGNTLTQGFQQSNFNITAIDEKDANGTIISVYPNPTSEAVNIVFNSNLRGFIYELYDMNGKKTAEQSVSGNTVSLDMMHYAQGVYTLRVFYENELRNFKIEKIK